MIVEYIRYTISADRAVAFERAYQDASTALDASAHCRAYDLTRCVDDPTQYVLRIEWDSAEGHLQGFRRSDEFRPFFAAIQPYVGDIAKMRHYAPTPVQRRKGESRPRDAVPTEPVHG